MTAEEIRDYCLSLPDATEDMVFGDDCILFRIFDKIFVCLSLVDEHNLALKCAPEYAAELREHYSEIVPPRYWNKKYWIQLSSHGSLKTEFIKSLIRHSYSQVVGKLPKKIKTEFPELLAVKE